MDFHEVHAVESSACRQSLKAGVRMADGNGSFCGFTAMIPLKQETLGENSPTTANHIRPVPQSVSIIV
jgi:hypothetical protein